MNVSYGSPLSTGAFLRGPTRRSPGIRCGSAATLWRAPPAVSGVLGWRPASESISLVVKILHLADTGSRLWPASEKPSDPMYWRREADALRAFEAEQLSGPFQAGRCRVVHERDDHHVELWLDDQQGEPGSTWDIGRLALASRHLGETQGAVTARGQVAEAWWSQGWLRAYTDRRYVDVAMLTDSSLWNLPHVRGHYDPAVGQALAKIWANRGELLSLVDHAPSTLCHMDLWPPNLFSDPDPACGCPKPCRGWSGSYSVFVDEAAAAYRSDNSQLLPGGSGVVSQPARSRRVGAENCVVAGQAAFRYSLMSPPQRAVLTTWRCLSGWSAASAATGGRWLSERWGRCVL